MNESGFVSELFLENNQFILIGLTGRTGSGCTTAANILSNENMVIPGLDDVSDFYKSLDLRRYSIVKRFSENNWDRFRVIKVSELITLYLLLLKSGELKKFVNSCIKSSHEECKKFYDFSGFYDDLETGGVKKIAGYLIEGKGSGDGSSKFNDDFSLDEFFEKIKTLTSDLKRLLNDIESGLYVTVYQTAGKSIRKIGKVCSVYENSDLIQSSVFHLPETINRLVKLIRKKEGKSRVVIDAIRNPYEVKFFKDRYAAFHLISINAPDMHRTKYLKSLHKFSEEQIKQIDDEESGKADGKYKHLLNPDVKKCIEASDIHIYNPKNEFDNTNILKAQLIWYVALMRHPGLISPTAMERVMQIAYSVKLNSGCISRQIGAVVTDSNNSVRSVGWNDVASGQIPCAMRSYHDLFYSFDPVEYSYYERNNDEFRQKVKDKYKKFEIKKDTGNFKGRTVSYCFKDIHNSIDNKGNQVHTRALHAEENAFLQLTKHGGQAVNGGKLYTTASPCELCAKKAYQLGISEIVFIDPYPGITRDHIINIGTKAPMLVQFRGAVGKAYHRLYEQVVPLKDELDYMLE